MTGDRLGVLWAVGRGPWGLSLRKHPVTTITMTTIMTTGLRPR
jgi:hypothetical protein